MCECGACVRLRVCKWLCVRVVCACVCVRVVVVVYSGVISDRGKVVSHPGASRPESSSHPARAFFPPGKSSIFTLFGAKFRDVADFPNLMPQRGPAAWLMTPLVVYQRHTSLLLRCLFNCKSPTSSPVAHLAAASTTTRRAQLLLSACSTPPPWYRCQHRWCVNIKSRSQAFPHAHMATRACAEPCTP
jgi:hypothetical protein